MLTLRKATIDDMQQYFDWANDTLVRQNSINTRVISQEEHQKWFESKLSDENSFLYLAETEQDQVGQVRFECKDGEATVNYSISDDFRGQGFGKIMLKQAIERISRDCFYIKIIKAKVKISNAASNKILLESGFSEQDKIEKIAVYHLALLNI